MLCYVLIWKISVFYLNIFRFWRWNFLYIWIGVFSWCTDISSLFAYHVFRHYDRILWRHRRYTGWTGCMQIFVSTSGSFSGQLIQITYTQQHLKLYHKTRNVRKGPFLRLYVNREGPDVRAHPSSLIWAFSVHRHILQCPTDSVSGQRKPWWACANAQADQGLHCPQIA